jgi:hypothetical protein
LAAAEWWGRAAAGLIDSAVVLQPYESSGTSVFLSLFDYLWTLKTVAYVSTCAIRQMLAFCFQGVFSPTDITRRCATVRVPFRMTRNSKALQDMIVSYNSKTCAFQDTRLRNRGNDGVEFIWAPSSCKSY